MDAERLESENKFLKQKLKRIEISLEEEIKKHNEILEDIELENDFDKRCKAEDELELVENIHYEIKSIIEDTM